MAGCCQSPKDIRETEIQAAAAASRVLAFIKNKGNIDNYEHY
jgi:heterodisulfide reductase subunit A-like polyferredoxin